MSSENCGGCKEEISRGTILTAMDKKWHPNCFVCVTCSEQITGGEFSIKTNDDGEDMPCCMDCGNASSGGPPGDCPMCGKKIQGAWIVVDGKNLHADCFVCSECGDVIDGSKGFNKDKQGNPFCFKCAGKKGMGPGKAGEVCATCGKALIGDCITAMENNYHKDCFVCSKCEDPITGGYAVGGNGKPICAPCKNGEQRKKTKKKEEPKKWLTKDKVDQKISEKARDINTRGHNNMQGDSDDDEPAPRRTQPKKKEKPAKSSAPKFCGDCGSKYAGGAFCGECGWKWS